MSQQISQQISQQMQRVVRDTLSTKGIRRTLARGEILFRQGDIGNVAFLIESGWVKINVEAGGREALIDVAGPGELIGEVALADGGHRSGTVRILEDTKLYVVSHSALEAYAKTHPEMIWELMGLLANRLRRANKINADMKNVDVPGRIALRLLDLADLYGVPWEGGTLIRVPLTQEELGQMVGASRESVNKAIGTFANRGWLKIEDGRYRLIDQPSLQRRAV